MSALTDLMKTFAENEGALPPVNPPQAQKVLETQTAPEVAGETVPELPPVVVPAPVAKPPEVVAAEAAPKVRRTAAVVQSELDEANAQLALQAKIIASHEADGPPVEKGLDLSEGIAAELKSSEARNEELTRTIETLSEGVKAFEAQEAEAAKIITTMQVQIQTLQAAGPAAAEGNLDSYCAGLDALGFTVNLTYRGGS